MLWITQTADEMDCINITRGDDAGLPVDLYNGDDPYVMGENEYLIFGARELPDTSLPLLLQITSAPGSNVIVFTHSDTADMAVGEYSADIQLMTATGRRVTVWPVPPDKKRTAQKSWKNFAVTPEVVDE